MTAEPVIELDNVCFAYDQDEVLHNVTLRIEARGMVAFVGPNGGGKTTLLRLILGLRQPRLGTVRVFGQAPEKARRQVGYVPQYVQFDPQFPVTAFNVVEMGRVERHWVGPYRSADRQAVLHALEQVEMADLRKRAFSELSGGERQRVLIAQALATEPDILLLDEPTANVDAWVESRIYELLKELNKHLTIVLVSHNLNVVTSYVDHVVCVNRTAEMHPVADLTSDVVQQAYGGAMILLHHGAACHVIDPREALRAPHRGTASRSHGEDHP